MSNPISSSPLSIHANSDVSFFERLKKCYDAITECVMKIFKQIGEFFYNLFHAKPKNEPLPHIAPIPDHLPEPEILAQPVIIPAAPTGPQSIISFYRGEAPHNGITVQDILSADDEWLENNDQWVLSGFPTWCSPIGSLDKDAFLAMVNDPIIRANILAVFKRALNFFGLQLNDKEQVEKSPQFDERAKQWITPDNRNYSRISRIIGSMQDMRNLGKLGPLKEGYGGALARCLETIFDYGRKTDVLSHQTFIYWMGLAFH